MTTRKKNTLKKILEREFGKKIIKIYNLDQGTTGEKFNAIIEWEEQKYEYELLHLYRHRDVIIRNYRKI